MRRSLIVVAALCLVTLAGCKARQAPGVDGDQGGGAVGNAQQNKPAQATPAPGDGPSVAPGPVVDPTEIDSDLGDVDTMLNDTDGELSGADETPPDQD